MADKTSISLTYNQIFYLNRHHTLDNEIIFTKVSHDIDVESLQLALQMIVDRHSLFRTSFHKINKNINNEYYNDNWEGYVHSIGTEYSKINLRVINHNSLQSSNISEVFSHDETSLNNMILSSAITEFKVDISPLIKASLHLNTLDSLGETSNILVISIDPVIWDKWCFTNFLDELKILYQSTAYSLPFSLPALPIEMSLFANWQREQLNGPDGERLWMFWHDKLQLPLPILTLPIDKPRPPTQSFQASTVSHRLSAGTTNSLLLLAEKQGATMYALMLAAFQTFLYRYTGQDDICIGALCSSRPDSSLNDLIGHFENIVVYRCTKAHGNPIFLDLLQDVRQQIISVRAHSDIPFGTVIQKLVEDENSSGGSTILADESRFPIFQVMFDYQYSESGRSGSLPLSTMFGLALGESGPSSLFGGLNLEPMNFSSTLSPFDINLQLAIIEDELMARWTFNTDIFSTETIDRMSKHFFILLESIYYNPEQKLSDLSLIDSIERKTLLVDWNNTSTSFPSDKLLHQLVELQAEKTPEAIALVNDEIKLTYFELNSKANQLAHYLRFSGVQPEDPVPIFLERSPSFIISLLAILKSGGVCMPLDPAYPSNRLEYMFEQSEAKVIVTSSNMVSKLPTSTKYSTTISLSDSNIIEKLRVVFVDSEADIINRGSILNPIPQSRPNSLAYILYTSGSTGQPKGVCLQHISLVNYVSWHIKYYEMTSQDRHAHYSSLAFDASMAETWPTFAVGGSLWQVCDQETRLNPYKLLNWFAENQITMSFLTTQLCENVLAASPYPFNLSLRILYTGGDKLHRGASNGAKFKLVNIYGPTENTINSTMCAVPTGQAFAPPIGKVVPNTQIYILDTQMQPVPIGVYGELYLGGIQLARGYFKRPDLSAEKFILNPFADDKNSKLYKTGDLVRYLTDGTVEFLGRRDTQVKIRGFRIELDEIESALLDIVGMSQVCAMAREDRPGDKKLVAYIVLAKDSKLNSIDIRNSLKEKLPSYMVPSAIIILQFLPLTPNGKLARNELPMPQMEDMTVSKYVAPVTSTQKAVADLISSVLQLQRVGMDDHFFDLGGHSLSATQLLTRLKNRFGIDMPLSRLLGQTATIGQLAGYIDTLIKTVHTRSDKDDKHVENVLTSPDIEVSNTLEALTSAEETITHSEIIDRTLQEIDYTMLPVPENSMLVLSYNQNSLYFLSQLDPKGYNSMAYNIPFATKFVKKINPSLLKKSFLELQSRHSILRTLYAQMNVPGGDSLSYFQIVKPVVETSTLFEWEELSTNSMKILTNEEDAIRSYMLNETYTPIDLEHGPTMKCKLITSQNGGQYLLWLVHHIAVDLWSMVVLLSELQSIYSFYFTNDPLYSLPSPRMQYYHSVAEQAKITENEECWAFWQRKLAEPLPVLQLPLDFQRPPMQTYRGAHFNITIPKPILKQLRTLAKTDNSTLYAVLLSAYYALLHRYSQQEDIIVGTPMACRTSMSREECAGYFVNPVCIRCNISGNPSFRSLMQRVRNEVLSALSYQEMPFSLLVEKMVSQRDYSRSPVFQTMFVLQKPHIYGDEGLAMFFVNENGSRVTLNHRTNKISPSLIALNPTEHDLMLESFAIGHQHAQFDLTLMCAEDADNLVCSFHYNTSLFTPETISRFAEHYLQLLKSAVINPDATLSILSILSSQERNYILNTLNNTTYEIPRDKCVHELVEAQVVKTPNALAVCAPFMSIQAQPELDPVSSLSYEQLNIKANQLAHYLRFLGCTSETMIPILLSRSPRFIISLLAVMKAGGVCVPIDPSYPKQRLLFMFQQAEASIIITENHVFENLPADLILPHVNVVLLDDTSQSRLINMGNVNNLMNISTSTNLAYVLYTSGSTGMPKGVMLPHEALVNYIHWHIRYYEMKSSDRHAHFAAMSFDASMAETWPTLTVGASLWHVVGDDIRLQPSKLMDWLTKYNISMIFMTTQLCEALLATPYPDNFSLRVLYTGGDKLHRGATDGAKFRLVNIYGPTECTVNILLCDVPVGSMLPPPIGKTVANSFIYILDDQMEPVPLGVYGELYIGGVQLSRGYYKRPDLTKERFVPNPFSNDPNSKLYRTGDLVRYLPDGNVEFLGRKDGQVKIRGFRIELGEIEAALLEFVEISEISVICREDKPGEKKIVAYIILKAGKILHLSDIKTRLRAKLPEFMVPSAFVFLEHLILTPNGKVDRNLLPPPTISDITSDRDFIAPKTTLDVILADICCQVLGLSRVGMNDNFFDLGGHSLAASQLLARIREKLSVDLPLGRLFETPTLAALADAIQSMRIAPTASSSIKLINLNPMSGIASGVMSGGFSKLNSKHASGSSTPDNFSRNNHDSPSIRPKSHSGFDFSALLLPNSKKVFENSANPSIFSSISKKEVDSVKKLVSMLTLEQRESSISKYQKVLNQRNSDNSCDDNISVSSDSHKLEQATSFNSSASELPKKTKITALHALRSKPPMLGGKPMNIGSVISGSSMPTSLISASPTGNISVVSAAPKSAAKIIEEELFALENSNKHPMTYQQSSLWFMNKINPSAVTYTVYFIAKIFSNFDESCMYHSLRLLMQRHCSLRTTFFEESNTSYQYIHPLSYNSVYLPSIGKQITGKLSPYLNHVHTDAIGVDFKRINAQLYTQEKLINELRNETHTPFDLVRGPIFRTRFFRENDAFSTGKSSGTLHIMAHHIAIDGWSLDLLIQDLGKLYASLLKLKYEWEPTDDALLTGDWSKVTSDYWASFDLDSILEPCGSTMAQYAYYQKHILASSESDKLFSFWQKTLSAPLPILNLNTDKPRPPVATYKGKILSFPIPQKISNGLRKLAKEEKSTIYMLLLSSWLVLLQKYTHQDDILLGTPMACRSQVHLERTIGNLVNPAVLRSDLSGNPTFSKLLVRIKQLVIAVFSHQEYPFPLLVEKLQTFRDPSRSAFFQVFFSLNQKFMKSSNSSFVDGESSGYMEIGSGLPFVVPVTMPQDVSPFDLTLVMTETDSSMSGSFQYNTDLFHESTMVRMSGHLINLFSSILSDVKAPISSLSCLDEFEWKQLTVDWNQTKAEIKGRCVHRIFESQVQLNPESIAIADGIFNFSYQELNSRANKLAHFLRESFNLRSSSIIAVCLKRSFQLIVTHLAIMKAGCAYLPIDPAYPQDRIEYMLEDSQSQVVITEMSVNLKINSTSSIVTLDSSWLEINKQPSFNPRSSSQVSGRDLVYIIYTSGSTGKPKGVCIEHEPLVSMSQWHAKEYGHSEQSRSSQMIAPAFDPVALEIWPFLTTGGSVHIMPDKIRSVPVHLTKWLCSNRITGVLFATPVAETVIHERWPAHHCVKFITAGGDKLHRGTRYPQTFRFDNHYGPSEATVITTFSTLLTEYDANGECIAVAPPIGKPVANTYCYVLDTFKQPVPLGVPGELYVGGDCLARGYLNRPDLTKERFIRSPFSADPSERIYKTGDLVRYLPDGNLEFLGRVDLQVKIRGFRIELGEIESVLATHISIRECCIEVREPKPGNKQLVGYIKWHSEHISNVDVIRAYLKESLPDYMIPVAFVILDTLPLTANGKVDRKRLPDPDWNNNSSNDYIAPESSTQITIAKLWSSVLGVSKVGIHDNFFELGGHSLSAAAILTKIREEFGGLEVPISKIFEETTVFKLSRFIDMLNNGGNASELLANSSASINFDTEASTIWSNSNLSEMVQAQIKKNPKSFDNSRFYNLSQTISPPKVIFLTGSSGYLGAYLLYSLLSTLSNVVVHCLVRADDSATGLKRILDNLKTYHLLTEPIMKLQNKIVPVCGDLALPMFGLNSDAFEVLASQISDSNNGSIYHCGALVNSVLPYSQLKTPNVLGSLEIIRLSIKAGVRPIHHVSTLSVFPDGLYKDAITEDSLLPSAKDLREGYAISKWVADQVMIYAFQKHNIPVVIYRPGRITGDHIKGIASVEDVMCRMTKGCLQLGIAPDFDWLLDMTPVDFVSQAIVELSRHQTFVPCIGPAHLCPTFHLCNGTPIHWRKLVNWMNKYGYKLKIVSYSEWRKKLLSVCRNADNKNALQPLLSIFSEKEEDMGTTETMPKFDPKITFTKLSKYKVVCPPVDDKLLDIYFQFYISSGFLFPPQVESSQFDFDDEKHNQNE